MTSVTQQRHYPELGNYTGLILFLLAVTAGIALLIHAGIQSPSLALVKPIPQIQYQDHAIERHDSDALAIRKCRNSQHGADEMWGSADKKTFYLWCKLPDGHWGFIAIVQDAVDRLWYESTSFIKSNGTRNAFLNYMKNNTLQYFLQLD